MQPHYVVAETAKGNFAVLEYQAMPHLPEVDEDSFTIDGYYRFATFYVVSTFEEMSQQVSSALASEVIKRIGVQVQELDI